MLDQTGASEAGWVATNDPVLPEVRQFVPQSDMTATATSVHGSTPATHAIDGRTETLWETDWSRAENRGVFPQSITLDLGASYNLSALQYIPRLTSTGSDPMKNSWAWDYKIYVSETADHDGTRVDAGTMTDNEVVKRLTFTPTEGRYLTLKILSAYSSGATADTAGAGELNVEYVTAVDQPVAVTPAEPIFVDETADAPASLTINETEGVTYTVTVNGNPVTPADYIPTAGDRVIVTGETADGYVLAPGAVDTWMHTYENFVDTRALRQAVTDAENTDLDGKTSESIAMLQQALVTAREVLVDPHATQNQVDEAEALVRNAIAGLADEPVEPHEGKPVLAREFVDNEGG